MMDIKTGVSNNNERLDANFSSAQIMGCLALFLSLSQGVHGFSWDVRCADARLHTSGKVISCSAPRHYNRSTLNLFHHFGGKSGYPSELQYQNVDGMADGGKGQPAQWWNSVFRKDNGQSQQQEIVDDYLEFLERRYHRVYDDEDDTINFSALNWLTQPQRKTVEIGQEAAEEDALYVLGVAGLASERLLQKHGKQKVVSAVKPAAAVTTVDAGVVVSNPRLLAAINPFLLFFRRVEAQRRLFLRYQVRKVNDAVSLLLKSLFVAPFLALRAAWTMGGGRKVVTFTLTAVATVSLLLRPVIESILSGGSFNA